MNSLKYIACVFLLSLWGCGKKDNIEGAYSKDLDLLMHTFSAIKFISNDTGFIAGSFDSVKTDTALSNYKWPVMIRYAQLYRTTDGGKKWEKSEFGNGYFTDIIGVGNMLYALKRSEDYTTTSAYYSKNAGTNWIRSDSFPNRVYDVIPTDHSLIAVGNDSSGQNSQIYFSDNEGKTWSAPLNLPCLAMGNPVILNGQMYYLGITNTGNYYPQLLVIYNIEAHTSKSILLPKGFESTIITSYQGMVMMPGSQDGYITVYSLKRNGSFERSFCNTNEKNMHAFGFYRNKDENWIIVRKTGDVCYKLLKTDGTHWDGIEFKDDQEIEPFCFLTDGNHVKAWFYKGLGRYQVMN